MARYTSRQTTVVFSDTDGSDTMTIGPGEGDFTIGDTNKENAEHIRVLNRGVFDGFVLGDDLVQDWSITVQVENAALTSGGTGKVWDFVMKTGSFASANSTAGLIWGWKTIVTMNDTATTAIITLPVTEGNISFSEGKETSTFSISGTNNGAFAIT